jgi:hypothetical protein
MSGCSTPAASGFTLSPWPVVLWNGHTKMFSRRPGEWIVSHGIPEPYWAPRLGR